MALSLDVQAWNVLPWFDEHFVNIENQNVVIIWVMYAIEIGKFNEIK